MNRFQRQQDLVDKEIFDNRVTIVGVGGIGSFLTLTLAKMGFTSISIYDFDMVEDHNLPNQFYRVSDINALKTGALAGLVRSFTDTNINTNSREWLASHKTKGVLISCVDNMDSREAMFEYAVANPSQVPWFIDGRMGRLQAEIYVVNTSNKGDIVTYRKRLWRESQVEPIPCTEKAIIFNVVFIASIICAQLRLALEGKLYKPAIIADLENVELTYFK